MGHEYLRDFLRTAQKLGWAQVGTDGRGHPRLHHEATDSYYSVPFSPSDHRSQKNALADLERLSGQKLERPNAAKYKHRRQQQVMDIHRSTQEREASAEVDHLVSEASSLDGRWRELITQPSPRSIDEARRILHRYEVIRERLGQLHRIVPPLNGTAS